MRKTTRLLAMVGMTLVTSAAISMGATGATAAPTTATTPVAVQHVVDPPPGDDDNDRWGDRDRDRDRWRHRDRDRWGDHWGDRDRWRFRDRGQIVRYYFNRIVCFRAGWIGQRNGHWISFQCVQGIRGHYWALRVQRGWRGGW